MQKDMQGTITFVNHEKKYVMIEFEQHDRKKTVRGYPVQKAHGTAALKSASRQLHQFLPGDVVQFTLQASAKGDRQVAANIHFLYNNALDVLIQQAATNNRFTGYLKLADDKYFVKEINSYLFFPVAISPWQLAPAEQELNEQVTFSLENVEKKDMITASLMNNEYIPEFRTAVKLYKAKTPVKATVYKVSPFAVYLNVVDDKIQAKLSAEKIKDMASLKPGDTLEVMITYLSKMKIAIEPVGGQ